MSLEIKAGDLVKLSGLAEHRFGVSYGTVIDIQDDMWARVMMYRGGLGQFTEKLHLSRLELVFPVGKL